MNNVEDGAKLINNIEEIGISGKITLQCVLNEDFKRKSFAGIQKFQDENGILLPQLKTMFPLLNLLGIKNIDFNQSVMELLREKLIERIEDISNNGVSQETLKTLLDKSFQMIKFPMVQPVVMILLKEVDVIDDKYLKLIVSDPSLYKMCDISVKRHIWQLHPTILLNELSILIQEYIDEEEKLFTNIKDARATFFILTPKQRRQNMLLQTLTSIVDKNVIIYDTVLQCVRSLFGHTKLYHYSTLRVSLLMELHESSVNDITSMDVCYKFTWCLDACIRENALDSKRIKELQGLLDNIKKGNENILGELAFALFNPYAVNFLVKTIMRILNTQINNESMPRDHQTLQFLLRLLNLGLHAHEILYSPGEPKFNPDILTKFLPIIMGFMVDDSVRSVNAKLPPDDRESALTIIEHCGTPPNIFNILVKNPVAEIITIYYIAQAARQRDRQAVIRVLGCLAFGSIESMVYFDCYQQILVAGLIKFGEEFANEDLCSVVFDVFFLPSLGINKTDIHLIKLVYHIYKWLPQKQLKKIMDSLRQHIKEKNRSLIGLFEELIKHMVEYKDFILQFAINAQEMNQNVIDNPVAMSARGVSSLMASGSNAYSSLLPTAAPMGHYYPPSSPQIMPSYMSGTMSPMPYQSPYHQPSSHPASISQNPTSSSSDGYPSLPY